MRLVRLRRDHQTRARHLAPQRLYLVLRTLLLERRQTQSRLRVALGPGIPVFVAVTRLHFPFQNPASVLLFLPPQPIPLPHLLPLHSSASSTSRSSSRRHFQYRLFRCPGLRQVRPKATLPPLGSEIHDFLPAPR